MVPKLIERKNVIIKINKKGNLVVDVTGSQAAEIFESRVGRKPKSECEAVSFIQGAVLQKLVKRGLMSY